MDRTAAWIVAGLGGICIYAGYRLFCTAPVAGGRTELARRTKAVLANFLPGAVLALFGAAILTTAAQSLFMKKPAAHGRTPASGTSLRLHHTRTEIRT